MGENALFRCVVASSAEPCFQEFLKDLPQQRKLNSCAPVSRLSGALMRKPADDEG